MSRGAPTWNVGIKEQVINDSEVLVMMYDERRSKTVKTRTFSLLYCLCNICFSQFNGNERVVKFSENFNGYTRKYYQVHLLVSEENLVALALSYIEQSEGVYFDGYCSITIMKRLLKF